MDKLKALLLSTSAVLLLAACGTDAPEDANQVDDPNDATEEIVEDTEKDTDETNQTFTLDELSEYDGKDGNLAYVAVDGVVYDVTGVDAWAGGEHAEDLTAGNDHTEAILASPHGKDVLDDLTEVGTLTDE